MNGDDEDFSSDSDDADYVPSDGEAVSEEENSGDDEDVEEDAAAKSSGSKKNKSKQKSAALTRKRQGGIRLEEENGEDNGDDETGGDQSAALVEEMKKEEEQRKEEEDKKRSDDLWASFLSDVGGPKSTKTTPKTSSQSAVSKLVKPSSTVSSPAVSANRKPSSAPTKADKVTITKLFDFAGETVKVTKQVDANSKEAKELEKETECGEKPALPPVSGVKRPGGLGSVLGMINKKPKISTLSKSKLDWESFKSEEGINEELEIHNRGKAGYIERQKFLNRTDQRQFEIERDVRLTSSKR